LRKSGGFTRVYAMGAVPGTPAYPYVVIGYAPNAPVVRSMTHDGDPVRRFTVQHFGRHADAVEDVAADTFAIFDGQPIDGDVCTQEVATLVDRDPDDRGVLSTTHTYRF
jgi:hypothetical protein